MGRTGQAFKWMKDDDVEEQPGPATTARACSRPIVL